MRAASAQKTVEDKEKLCYNGKARGREKRDFRALIPETA